MSEEKTYKIKCFCDNCGFHFEISIPFGISLQKSDSPDGGLYYKTGTYSDKWIKCTKCGTLDIRKSL